MHGQRFGRLDQIALDWKRGAFPGARESDRKQRQSVFSHAEHALEHRRVLFIRVVLTMLILGWVAVPEARADDGGIDSRDYQVDLGRYFQHWFDRVDAAQASQPSWMTPLVTVTARLTESVRYDQYWEHAGNGSRVDVYDANHFLELIPTTTNEVLLNPPAYEVRSGNPAAAGWGDWPFLQVKQRLLSANEHQGNYILTALVEFQIASGNTAFTNRTAIITPGIAGGKGWGKFNIQTYVAFPIPTSHTGTIGYSAELNVALQYNLLTYFWPEFEVNTTRYFSGLRGGKTQVFLTPGLILGVFPIYNRIRATIGAGYQFAVAPKLTRTPVLTPVYDHAWIVSAHMLF